MCKNICKITCAGIKPKQTNKQTIVGMRSFWIMLLLECDPIGWIQMKCASFKMCSKCAQNVHLWNPIKIECAQNRMGRNKMFPSSMCSFGLCLFWNVLQMESAPFECDLFGMCSKWNVLELE